ncbi:MAG TPA: Gfo/Idh/MocA family oxidoreductase [Opitutaceae bacterium]|nr:Gfo/Idh/MocA family oxidoreductase [Opitutaceae bacterium]
MSIRSLPFWFLSRWPNCALALCLSLAAFSLSAADLRVGMIGLDTSHTVAFAKVLNNPDDPNYVPGAVITAAYRSGSPDMPEKSMARVPGYAKELSEKYNVKLYDSIEELLKNVDVVMIENVDGRKHLEIARVVFPTGKPVFIDKPLAGTLAEGMEIAELAKKHNVPFFSASSLRYSGDIVPFTKEKGKLVHTLITHSPCELEPHHPDLFWYGVHGVEMLYTVFGTGCKTVSRATSNEGDVVTGMWADGRIGTFIGYRQARAGYGYKAILKEGVINEEVKANYVPMLKVIVQFFQTQKPPVSVDEMLEVLAFMEAADESKRQGGKPVSVADVMNAHRQKLATTRGTSK